MKLAELVDHPRVTHFVEGPFAFEATIDPEVAVADVELAWGSKALVVRSIVDGARRAGKRFALVPEEVGGGWDALFDVLVDDSASERRASRRVVVIRGIDRLFAERPLDAGRLVELLLDVAEADASHGRTFRVLYVVGALAFERQMNVSTT
jgi:hypothetical protein